MVRFNEFQAMLILLLLLFLGLVLWPRREIQNSPGDLAPIARALTFGGLTLAVAYGVTDSTLLVWPWIMFGLIRAATWLAVRQARDLRGSARSGLDRRNGGNGRASAPSSPPGGTLSSNRSASSSSPVASRTRARPNSDGTCVGAWSSTLA